MRTYYSLISLSAASERLFPVISPTEMTSKRAVPRFRQVVEVTKDVSQLTRFDKR